MMATQKVTTIKKHTVRRRGGGGGAIYINSPVILGITFTSALILSANSLTSGAINYRLMSRFTSWLDPLMYLRFFSGALTHADMNHYFANFMLILVVGPMMEERYGERRLLAMLSITAFTTGLCNALFFPQYAVMGASGLAFMLILLCSFVNVKKTGLPLTMLLVSFFYIGNEIIGGLLLNDNISQFSHIIGGVCGAVFGFYFKNDGGVKRAAQ